MCCMSLTASLRELVHIYIIWHLTKLTHYIYIYIHVYVHTHTHTSCIYRYMYTYI